MTQASALPDLSHVIAKHTGGAELLRWRYT